MAGKLIAANWKMNGSLERNDVLVSAIVAGSAQFDCDVVLCVPAPYLAQVAALLRGTSLALAGQDLSEHEAGAFTGDISAAMLRDFGCSHVIIGHSERRKYHCESDALVLLKVRRALAAGLTPVLCVGESLEQRQAGASERVVLQQLEAVFAGLDDLAARRLVIAYEPVWAIGTGMAATPEMAQAVHARIREALGARLGEDAAAVPILYGGSVNADNAETLFAMADIDGALVGGASLDSSAFLSICAAAAAK